MRFQVEQTDAGQRLDHALTRWMPEVSRARLQEWVEQEQVLVSGVARKPSYRLKAGEEVAVTPVEVPQLRAFAEEIPVEVLYEDAGVVAVNKPAGMVVHSGAGRHSGTLVNALLHRFGTLSGEGGELRPGIVHRLDKGTSGVLLVAKNDAAHRMLAAQFAAREVEKVYIALVQGVVKKDRGQVDAAITRDPHRRTRMTAALEFGRSAHTEFTVVERLAGFTLLEVRIGTGRTHQIRVHLASLRHPVAGDTLYGAAGVAEDRPFLHARQIGFVSPATGRAVVVEAPLAPELAGWLNRLRSGSLEEGS